MMWHYGLLIVACAVGLWLLYDNGYMLMQSKRALTFVGSGIGRQSHFGFQFTGCTGSVSRVLRVKESGTYTVTLDSRLSKGSVRFLLLDGAKAPVLVLNPEKEQGGIYLEHGKRYFVRMEFDHASGDSRACWVKE